MAIKLPKPVQNTDTVVWDTPQVELVYLQLDGGGRGYELRVKPELSGTHGMYAMFFEVKPTKRQLVKCSAELLRVSAELEQSEPVCGGVFYGDF